MSWRAQVGRVGYWITARAWRSPAAFLALVALVHVVIVRRAFAAGGLADIDSICHVSYLRYLTEEFHPATGAFFGFTPKYNLGAPFLLYNVPPGLSFAGAGLVWLGFSAASAIKGLLVVSYLSLPTIAFFFARASVPEEERSGNFPRFAAIFVALFSSELFGLEFFLHNGMANACVAVPLFALALLAFRHAESGSRPGLALGFAAFLVAALLLTHVLGAYFFTVGLAALVLGGTLDKIGRRALLAVAAVALGVALAAFWIVPSASFAPKEELVYNWVRNPKDVAVSFLDGSLIASFFGGFSPEYRSISNLGLIAIALGAIGFVESFRLRAAGVRSVAVLFTLCFLILLGPKPTFGLGWLPGYPHLLWYRFLSPAIYAWLLLSAYGAARVVTVCRRGRFAPLVVSALLGCAILWCIGELEMRGRKIRVLSEYATFFADYERVTSWLREHGDRRGRVYGEFLAFAPEAPPSVNYLRQMLPVDTGFSEVGGWVYENSSASIKLAKEGSFWWSPLLLTGDAERLALKYVVAAAPHTRSAFDADVRWNRVVDTPSFALYEAKDFTPRLATCGSREVKGLSEAYLKGGGYRYAWKVAPSDRAESCVLRVNASDAWTVEIDGAVASHRTTSDGFVVFDVPASAQTVACTFATRARGATWVSVGALAMVAALLAIGRLPKALTNVRAIERGGRTILAIAFAGTLFFGRKNDVSNVAFGLPTGIEALRDPHDTELGTVRELEEGRSIHLHEGAWEAPSFFEHRSGRVLHTDAQRHVSVRLAKDASVTIVASPHRAPLELVVLRADGSEACRLHGAEGAPLAVPEACRHDAGREAGPGRQVDVRIETPEALHVTAIKTFDRALFVQAESFHNVSWDSGYEAFTWVSHPRATPENGFTIIPFQATSPRDTPITMAASAHLDERSWDVWILSDVGPREHDHLRGRVVIAVDGKDVGAFDGVADDVTVAMMEVEPHFRWIRLGRVTRAPGSREAAEVTLSIVGKPGAAGIFAEVDAVAFSPADL